MDNRTLTMFQVDAFTHKVFGGNSAAVVPLTQWLADELMQTIAMENNLSETVFFVPLGSGHYHIRWFTPEVEVDLCGHATLAAAHIIFTQLDNTLEHIRFDSLSGPLAVQRNGQQLTLDFPNRMPVINTDAEFKQQLEEALGTQVESIHEARDVLVVLKDEAAVRALNPDLIKLSRLQKFGFTVTAEASMDDADFVSRFFAPNQGVNEDPVTGSAHCTLAPYWAKQLGKNPLRAVQVSRRVGHLLCEVTDERVFIGGQCVTYLTGQISV